MNKSVIIRLPDEGRWDIIVDMEARYTLSQDMIRRVLPVYNRKKTASKKFFQKTSKKSKIVVDN